MDGRRQRDRGTDKEDREDLEVISSSREKEEGQDGGPSGGDPLQNIPVTRSRKEHKRRERKKREGEEPGLVCHLGHFSYAVNQTEGERKRENTTGHKYT